MFPRWPHDLTIRRSPGDHGCFRGVFWCVNTTRKLHAVSPDTAGGLHIAFKATRLTGWALGESTCRLIRIARLDLFGQVWKF